ncbi:uncharacterized protein A4U43_C08F11950 [Asparagus officinalis]|nr:uncharacterized protein A4U43_C08F11950 [Asparagus officinalis]
MPTICSWQTAARFDGPARRRCQHGGVRMNLSWACKLGIACGSPVEEEPRPFASGGCLRTCCTSEGAQADAGGRERGTGRSGQGGGCGGGRRFGGFVERIVSEGEGAAMASGIGH